MQMSFFVVQQATNNNLRKEKRKEYSFFFHVGCQSSSSAKRTIQQQLPSKLRVEQFDESFGWPGVIDCITIGGEDGRIVGVPAAGSTQKGRRGRRRISMDRLQGSMRIGASLHIVKKEEEEGARNAPGHSGVGHIVSDPNIDPPS